MSYNTWTVDGYGICADDIKSTKERVLRLVALSEQVEESVIDLLREILYERMGDAADSWEKEKLYKKAALKDVLEFEDDSGNIGIAALLHAVIEEKEDVCLVACYDFEGKQYLLFTPVYPWSQQSEGEKKIKTENDVDEIIRRYVSILTDKPLEITYHSVPNGG